MRSVRGSILGPVTAVALAACSGQQVEPLGNGGQSGIPATGTGGATSGSAAGVAGSPVGGMPSSGSGSGGQAGNVAGGMPPVTGGESNLGGIGGQAGGGSASIAGAAGFAGQSCSLNQQPFGAVVRPFAVPATACSSNSDSLPDECACGSLTCPEGESCMRVDLPAPFGTGGPDPVYNACFLVCTSDADCEPPSVCRENGKGVNECGDAPPCRTASDCTQGQGAICATTYSPGHAGAIIPNGSLCVYQGACEPSSCDGCTGDAYCHTCAAP